MKVVFFLLEVKDVFLAREERDVRNSSTFCFVSSFSAYQKSKCF